MSIKHTPLNTEKYKNAILFFLNYCNNKYLGKTKLNKLMYYADFISYRDRKKSLTNDIYYHLDFGPVPHQIDTMLTDMKRDKAISIEDGNYKDGHTKRFSTSKKPNMTVFDNYEKKLLESISKEMELWSTQKIVDQTHLESPWLYSEPYDITNYECASDIDLLPDLANVKA